MAVKPITISFKSNEEDRELYYWIISHSNLSGFVKDILRQEKNKEIAPIQKTTTKIDSDLIDLSDF